MIVKFLFFLVGIPFDVDTTGPDAIGGYVVLTKLLCQAPREADDTQFHHCFTGKSSQIRRNTRKVDDETLISALKSSKLTAAGLDVYNTEVGMDPDGRALSYGDSRYPFFRSRLWQLPDQKHLFFRQHAISLYLLRKR